MCNITRRQASKISCIFAHSSVTCPSEECSEMLWKLSWISLNPILVWNSSGYGAHHYFPFSGTENSSAFNDEVQSIWRFVSSDFFAVCRRHSSTSYVRVRLDKQEEVVGIVAAFLMEGVCLPFVPPAGFQAGNHVWAASAHGWLISSSDLFPFQKQTLPQRSAPSTTGQSYSHMLYVGLCLKTPWKLQLLQSALPCLLPCSVSCSGHIIPFLHSQ